MIFTIFFSYNSSRGLKEFGNPENLTNPDLPCGSGGGSSNVSPASVSPVGTKYLSAGAFQQNPGEIHRSSSQNLNDDNEKEENPIPDTTSLTHDSGVIEANFDISDDEVNDLVVFFFFSQQELKEKLTDHNPNIH